MKKANSLTSIFASIALSVALLVAVFTEWRFFSGPVPMTGSYSTVEIDIIGISGYRCEWLYLTVVSDSLDGSYFAMGSRKIGCLPSLVITSYGVVQVSGKNLF